MIHTKLLKNFELKFETIQEKIGLIEHNDMCYLNDKQEMVFSEVEYRINNFEDTFNIITIEFFVRYYTLEDSEPKYLDSNFEKVKLVKHIDYYMDSLKYQIIMKD